MRLNILKGFMLNRYGKARFAVVSSENLLRDEGTCLAVLYEQVVQRHGSRSFQLQANEDRLNVASTCASQIDPEGIDRVWSGSLSN